MFYHKLEKFARYLLYGTALLPLLISPFLFFPDKFAKGVVFRIIIEAVIVIALYLLLTKKLKRPVISPISVGLFVFWVVSLIATFLAENSFLAFWGEASRGGGFFNFSHFVIYFLLLLSFFRTKKDWLRFIDLAYLTSVIAGIIALIQFFVPSFLAFPFAYINPGTPGSTMGNPNFFAAFMLFFFFWGLIRLVSREEMTWQRRFLWAGTLIIIFTAILLTKTRGVYLGLLFGVFLFLLFFPYKKSKTRVAVGSAFIVILLLFFWEFQTSQSRNISIPYVSQITSLNFSNASVQTRLEGWSLLLEASVEKPLFGYGPENLSSAFNKYYRASFATHGESETYWDRAHNLAVDTIINTGYIGFIVLLIFWIIVFRQLQKARKEDNSQNKLYAHGLQVIFASYILQNLTNFDTFASYLPLFMFLGFTAFLTPTQKNAEEQSSNTSPPVSPIAIRIIIFILLIVYGFSFWSINVKPLLVNARTLKLLQNNNVTEAITEFEDTLKQDTYLQYDNRSKFIIYLQPLLNREEINQASKTVLIKRGIDLLEKNIKDQPNSVKSRLDLAAQYSRALIADDNKENKSFYNAAAAKEYEKLRKLSPRRQRILIEESKFYIIRQDIRKAIENLRKSVILNPDVTESHWWLGIAYLMEGRKERGEFWLVKAVLQDHTVSDQGIRFLENIYENRYTKEDLKKLFEIFKIEKIIGQTKPLIQEGKIDTALANLKEALKIDPNYPNTHWWIGIAYLGVGQKTKGEEALVAAYKKGTPIKKFGILDNFYKIYYSPEEYKVFIKKINNVSKQ